MLLKSSPLTLLSGSAPASARHWTVVPTIYSLTQHTKKSTFFIFLQSQDCCITMLNYLHCKCISSL